MTFSGVSGIGSGIGYLTGRPRGRLGLSGGLVMESILKQSLAPATSPARTRPRVNPSAFPAVDGRGGMAAESQRTGQTVRPLQILVPQALADHPQHAVFHLLQGVRHAHIVPSREFVHVALQVLRGHLVVRPHIAALEHAPERLHAIGVGLAAHILADRVLDGLMLERQRLVGTGLVGIDRRVRVRGVLDEAFSVSLSVHSTAFATTRFVSRSLAPTTAVLPTGPRPGRSLRT